MIFLCSNNIYWNVLNIIFDVILWRHIYFNVIWRVYPNIANNQI